MKKSIELELAQPDTQRNLELKSILEKTHEENAETLTKFIGQFVQLKRPPEDFQDAHQSLQQVIDPGHRIRLFRVQPGESVSAHDQSDLLNLDVLESIST